MTDPLVTSLSEHLQAAADHVAKIGQDMQAILAKLQDQHTGGGDDVTVSLTDLQALVDLAAKLDSSSASVQGDADTAAA